MTDLNAVLPDGRYRVVFPDHPAVEVTLRLTRKPGWLFWWPSKNVTFGRTIYEGGEPGCTAATLIHEARHVYQYRTKGWWWVWTHRRARETEARAWQTNSNVRFDAIT